MAATEDDFWHLHHIDWLSSLSSQASEALRRESTLRGYAPGATIFAPTPEAHSVYILEKGLVRIYRLSESGEEATFGFVTAGEVFGELVIFGCKERESFAPSGLATLTPLEVGSKTITHLTWVADPEISAEQAGERLIRDFQRWWGLSRVTQLAVGT